MTIGLEFWTILHLAAESDCVPPLLKASNDSLLTQKKTQSPGNCL